MPLAPSRLLGIRCMAALMAVSLPSMPATAQTPAKATMQKTTGMWVEGPGYDIKYGGTYEECATRCLAASACVMIEYYRPEKKCNMYDTVRPLKTGGLSIVGTKKSSTP
jgi:hypothetical protein